MALCVLRLIDDIGEFFTFSIVLTYGIGLRHIQVGDTHHRFDTISQGFGLLFGDGTFGQVIHKGEDTAHNDGNAREHQDHISES